MKKEISFRIVWALMFVGIFVILSQIGYSDGDDAFFYEYTHNMGLWEYLGWRYESWVGRMAAEALVYLTFHMGLWFWRLVNACMMVLLPMGILKLAYKAARIPEGNVLHWYEKKSCALGNDYKAYGIGIVFAAAAGYLLMSVMTLGYAAVWVNGSVFYTWTFTCGVYALMPLADLVYGEQDNSKDWKPYLYSIPCSIIAAMSIEQMGAVVLTLEILGSAFLIFRKKSRNPWMLVQTAVTLIAFLVLFTAPGNEIRVVSEIANWMPEYDQMTVGQHLFITVQWLLSSFANENRLFLCGIWIVGILLLYEKKEGKLFQIAAGIFTAAALLPFAGITVFSDLGMHVGDISVRVDKVPSADDLTAANIAALIWWGIAILFTFFFLWKVSACQVTLLLIYLAGIASEAIMYFSPTMYASGARVYYLTDLLYLFLMLCMSMELRKERRRNLYYGIVVLLGIGNLIYQIPAFLGVI